MLDVIRGSKKAGGTDLDVRLVYLTIWGRYDKTMRKFLLVTILLLLFAKLSYAALPTTDWKKIDNPSVDIFLTGLKNREYLSVVKNRSVENMNFDGQNESQIAHMLTLLRRVSLAPFGISDWKLSSVKKTTYLKYQVVKLQGSYTNKSGQLVSFFENIYFYRQNFIQLSWIQPEPASAPSEVRIENLFKNMELDYL